MTLTALLSALGLSGAAGLNAWLPVLLVAVLGRAEWIDLDPAFADLARTSVILVLFSLFALDFVADKIPSVDSAMHRAGMVVHPLVGAALFELQAGGATPLVLNLLLGAAVAGTLHAGRAATRPAINGASGGLGAPLVSVLEDIASMLLTIGSFVLPLLAGVAALAMLVGSVVIGRRARRAISARDAQASTPRHPLSRRRGGHA